MRLLQLIAIAVLIYLLIKILKKTLTKIQIREIKDERSENRVLINVNDVEDAEYEEIDKRDGDDNKG